MHFFSKEKVENSESWCYNVHNKEKNEDKHMSFVILGIHEDGIVIASDSASSNWSDKFNPFVVNNNTKKVFKSNKLIIGAFDDNQYVQNGVIYNLSDCIDNIFKINPDITVFEFVKKMDNILSFENSNRCYSFFIGTIENNKTEAFEIVINNKTINIKNIGRNPSFRYINSAYIREKQKLDRVSFLTFEEIVNVAKFTTKDVIDYVNSYCSIKAIGGEVQIEILKLNN